LIKQKCATYVAGNRGFWGRNAQALRQDTDKVGETRTVPEELVVVNVLLEALALAVASNLKHVLKVERVVCMGGGVSVLDVLLNHIPLVLAVLDRVHRALERVVVAVDGVDRGVTRALEHLHGDLDLTEGLEQLELTVDQGVRVDDRWTVHAKVVRDLGVVLVVELLEIGRVGLALAHKLCNLLECLQAGLDLVLGQLACSSKKKRKKKFFFSIKKRLSSLVRTERRLLRVIVHLHHGFLHRLDVEDKLHQGLDGFGQL